MGQLDQSSRMGIARLERLSRVARGGGMSDWAVWDWTVHSMYGVQYYNSIGCAGYMLIRLLLLVA